MGKKEGLDSRIARIARHNYIGIYAPGHVIGEPVLPEIDPEYIKDLLRAVTSGDQGVFPESSEPIDLVQNVEATPGIVTQASSPEQPQA